MEIDPNKPINKTAAIVVSRSDKDDNTRIKSFGHRAHFTIQPPTLKYKGLSQYDLTNMKRGRMLVVGVWALVPKKSKQGVRWVVRCDCGDYEVRTTKRLKSPQGKQEDRCLQCDHNSRLSLTPNNK